MSHEGVVLAQIALDQFDGCKKWCFHWWEWKMDASVLIAKL